VVGAGVAGLAAAAELAARGVEVIVLERAPVAGGKLRQALVGGLRIDVGPTVLTMRWVFDELFAAAGSRLEDHVTLTRAEVLARHAWSERERLDLFSEEERSADAIGALAGPREARGFRRFCARAGATLRALEDSYLRAARPSVLGLMRGADASRLVALARMRPFASLWTALGEFFRDPRLRQLFGRYATYVGSSPFAAPATLMLIAEVERRGVWLVQGGMQRLAEGLAALAAKAGANVRYHAEAIEICRRGSRRFELRLASGERLEADAVVCTAEVAALAEGRLGPEIAAALAPAPRVTRSLSAVTWALVGEVDGFPLVRHNVFFSRDCAAEFDALFRRRSLPWAPTVYVCAQDRAAAEASAPLAAGPERLFFLVNAPAAGDVDSFGGAEIERCETSLFQALQRCGMTVRWSPHAAVRTTPADFERRFPATGGALYGAATHGWRAAFRRPTSRSPLLGLYLAGGSTHPGAGVPMAALSGRQAAAAVLNDFASTPRSHPADTRGGTSTR
jgi:1-hydroxycarotenoid 3,4-desaturase